MNARSHYRIIGAVAGAVTLSTPTYAWTPLPVKSNRHVFLPVSKQGTVALESASLCDNCHGGINTTTDIASNWRGATMSETSRDPLWLACLTVADQHSIRAVAKPNAGGIGGSSQRFYCVLVTGPN